MSYQFGHIDRDDRIDYGDEPAPEDDNPPRRPLSGLLLVAGVMAVFAGALWFAYHEGAKHAAAVPAPDQVPLIRADTDPVKVKPDKVGGMDVPDKDNPIYTMRPGATSVERILPPPEAPAPRPAAPAPPIAAPASPAQVAGIPAPGASPLLTPAQVAALARPAAKPVPTRIQLASLRSPDAARDEWTRLKRENGDLLDRLNAVAVRADMGERGVYYRVEAGPLADHAAALRLCKALKDRGLECSLVQ